jgi:endoglucanase
VKRSTNVLIGGGGPWWGDYIFSMEPETGTGYVAYIDILTKYI